MKMRKRKKVEDGRGKREAEEEERRGERCVES
jgi:hypothetical protein